jgi:hypothetical protein
MLFQWLVDFASIGISSIPQSPRGYIDPNTGGMLFQVLAVIFAVFSGFLFFFSRQIKTGFARIKRFLRRSDVSGSDQPDNEEKPE